MENTGQNIGIGGFGRFGRIPGVNQVKSNMAEETAIVKPRRDGASFSSEAQILMKISESQAARMINILDQQNNIWNSLA